MMEKTVLVVPCFNEEARLPVAAFQRFAMQCPRIRFVLVDDGSRDRTADVLASLAASRPRQFELLQLDENRGKAEAVRRGMVHALHTSSGYVGFIDADLAAPLEEIPRMIDVLDRRSEVRAVVGSRIGLAGHSIRRRPVRRLLGRCFAAVSSTLLGLPLRDTQCGLKLFRADDGMRRLFADPFQSRWIFDVELLARLIADQGSDAAIGQIYELPLERWSEVAGSKLKSGDFVKAVGELAGIYSTYVRGRSVPHGPREAIPVAGAYRAA